MIFSKTSLPAFVTRELEKLEQQLAPFLKKASIYAFWSFPLITISIINLFILLFVATEHQNIWPASLLYAAIGAVGMALSKEAKYKQKEIQKMSANFIIERIKKSALVSDFRKKEYISRVKEQPLLAMQHLIKFLEEEKRLLNQD